MSDLITVQVTLVDSVDDAAALLRWLSTKTEVAFDVETTGLDVDVDRVRLFQLGDEERAWVVPYERWVGLVDEVVRRYEGIYVTHNGPSYDVPICRKHGIVIPPHRVRDTRTEAHVLDSTGSLALKNLAKRHVDPRADWGQHKLEEALGARGGWSWETIPYDFEPYWFYAGLDTVLTKRLDGVLWPRVQAEAPASYELELAVAWVAERMERHGVLVDRPYVGAFADRLRAYVDQVDDWCRATYDVYPGSDLQVIDALRRDGVELTKLTASGRPSVDKEVLSSLEHPLARAVLGRRQSVKLVSTYLETYLELSDRDGRIHPSINTVGGMAKNPFEPGGSKGVRTGRMSMNGPNLQNVPIRTTAGKKIRDAFIVAPGHRWVKADFDQIEMRVLTHLTREPGLIEAFTSDGDFFVNLARDLFADPTFRKSDPRRQLVKNGGYAKIYGAGIPKFAKTAGVPTDDAAAFMRRFDGLYPGVPTWTREIERAALRALDREGEAYVRSPLTQRKHVADAGRLYALVNYLIQGTAGEILKMKLVEADHAGLGHYMILPVHDEVDLEVPTPDLDDVVTTLRDVMNDDGLLAVPVTASIEVGERWGSVDAWETTSVPSLG